MKSTNNLSKEISEYIPFALINVGKVMDLEKLNPPEGYYDEQDYVWKLNDGSIPDYSCSSAGSETTWDATATSGGDTQGDPHPDYM